MKKLLSLFCLFLLVSVSARAANFVTRAVQGSGTAWTAAIWSNAAVGTAVSAPVAGNTYQLIFNGTQFGDSVNNTRTRNPAVAGVQTFPGDSLTMDAHTEIRAKVPAILNFPGVGGNPGLILNGGALNAGDNAIFEFQGRIHVASPSLISPGNNGAGAITAGRGIKFTGPLTGSGSLVVIQGPTNVAAMEVTSANNTYSGDWIVKAGFLKGTGVGSLGVGNIIINPAVTIPSGLVNPAVALAAGPARFEVMYDINSPANLTLGAGAIMVLHQNVRFSSVTISGTVLSQRVYPYSELVATFPNNFAPGGSGSINVAPPTPPPAPANVVAISGDTQVSLSWLPAPSANSYWVLRSDVTGGPYTPIANPTATSYVDTGLINGSSYYYVVHGSNNIGAGPLSAEVVGMPNFNVKNVIATGGTGQVDVAWDSLPEASSYSVRRSDTSGGPYTVVASDLLTTSYTDTTVQSGRRYFYVVIPALTPGGDGAFSNEASASTAPSAPALTASLFVSTVANLSWTLSDPAVTQFLIERATDGEDFSQIAAVAGTARAYTATGLSFDTTHTFRIRAVNSGGSSDYSNLAAVTTPTFGVHVNFAITTFATNFPGYVNDYSLVYGLRTNGMTYGWDADNTQHSRERTAGVSASFDKRYNTFTHMQKTTPLPAARQWEIEIPNGFYKVHFVSGDPENLDSVFQMDVEGVLTGAITPNATTPAGRFGDFNLTCTVSDGRLTVTNGPSAANNKINFIDIVAAIPDPIVIGTQPQPAEVEEGRRVTLSVVVTSGSTPIFYKWYANGNEIPGATGPTLILPHAQQDDSGDYFVEITNPAGLVTSDSAYLTVTPDTTPPTVVSAASLDGSVLKLIWNEQLDPIYAEDPATYEVNGGAAAVNSAVLTTNEIGDSNIVILRITHTAAASTTEFHVGVPTGYGVFDLYGNLQDSPDLATGKIFAFGSGLTDDTVVGTATDPIEKGSTTIDPNHLEVVAGGTDIWNNLDAFRYAYGRYTDNFDLKVRVTRLDPRNNWSKAGFVVRQDLAPGGPNINAVVTPSSAALDGTGPGANDFEAGTRLSLGAATTDWGVAPRPTNAPPFTNAWIRIQRAGNTFKAFYGTNGIDWIQYGTTLQTYPSTVLVGLGTTSHNNGPGQTTTAVYEDFGIILPPNITRHPQGQSVNQGREVTFVVEVSGTAPFTYQWRKNGQNITGATAATYTISGLQANDAGDYDVVVSNVNSSVNSFVATLFVNVPPSIASHPQSRTLQCGSVTFTVNATGTPLLTYQWRKGGVSIEGANQSTYTISSVVAGDAGNYSVVVSNDVGYAESDEAVLTVTGDTSPPAITCPGPITAPCTSAAGAVVTFAASALDNCDASPVVECTPASGSTFPRGATTVNCTARDASNNSAACSFTVTVQDTTPAILAITQSSNQVIITWPASCTAFTLKQRAAVDSGTWANAVGVLDTDGAGNHRMTITVAPETGSAFFRLE